MKKLVPPPDPRLPSPRTSLPWAGAPAAPSLRADSVVASDRRHEPLFHLTVSVTHC